MTASLRYARWAYVWDGAEALGRASIRAIMDTVKLSIEFICCQSRAVTQTAVDQCLLWRALQQCHPRVPQMFAL